MNLFLKSLTLAALLATAVGCATVSETGRSQLMLISPAEEMQLGFSEFDKLKAATPVSKDAAGNALLQRVGKRVSAVATLPGAQWEFVLFDQPDVPNAFCLPGGKVGVYTGILPITKTEAGLAAVIGHEVAHAVARHGGERVSQGLAFQLGGAALDVALQNNAAATRNIVLGAYGIGGQVGVLLPYSRKQELEADHLGLMYMARAGYDPREAIGFWQRFEAYKGGGGQPEFLSTHPVDATRIQQLEQLMPAALREYEAATSKPASGGATTY